MSLITAMKLSASLIAVLILVACQQPSPGVPPIRANQFSTNVVGTPIRGNVIIEGSLTNQHGTVVIGDPADETDNPQIIFYDKSTGAWGVVMQGADGDLHLQPVAGDFSVLASGIYFQASDAYSFGGIGTNPPPLMYGDGSGMSNVVARYVGNGIYGGLTNDLDGGDFILSTSLGQLAGMHMSADFNLGRIKGVKYFEVEDAADPAAAAGNWTSNGLVLLQGRFIGNGSGLTNVLISEASGAGTFLIRSTNEAVAAALELRDANNNSISLIQNQATNILTGAHIIADGVTVGSFVRTADATAPVDTGTVVKWISVKLSGDPEEYRIPLYK